MSVTLTTTLGAHRIECTGETLVQTIKLASLLSECPQECGHCQSNNIAFNHRVASGYDFYALRCRKCGAEFSFGQRRDGGGLFPKGPWQMPQRNRSDDDAGSGYHQTAAPGGYHRDHDDPGDPPDAYFDDQGRRIPYTPPSPSQQRANLSPSLHEPPPQQPPSRHAYSGRDPVPASHRAPGAQPYDPRTGR